jgi:hypothetical protein
MYVWTPVEISQLFFDRIKAPKKLKILENAGHFPIRITGFETTGTGMVPVYPVWYLWRIETICGQRTRYPLMYPHGGDKNILLSFMILQVIFF